VPVQGRAKAGGLSAAQAKLSDFLISPKSVPMLAFRTMRPSEAFHEHRAAIRQIVERHRACNVRVFGSVLHGDDVEGGDLDLLVDPLPQATLMDIAAIQLDLEKMLGIPVDVLTPKALPEKFRGAVLAEAEPV
jgi:predicted nucleotidyltransferase